MDFNMEVTAMASKNLSKPAKKSRKLQGKSMPAIKNLEVVMGKNIRKS